MVRVRALGSSSPVEGQPRWPRPPSLTRAAWDRPSDSREGAVCAMDSARDSAHHARTLWVGLAIGLGACGLPTGCAHLHTPTQHEPTQPPLSTTPPEAARQDQARGGDLYAEQFAGAR